MIARAGIFAAFVALVLLSPLAVAAANEHAQINPDSGPWLKDYGPTGVLVLGIVGVVWRVAALLRPKAEAFLDAGIAERLAFRDLARSLQHRFSDESIEERKLFREAIEALRTERVKP